MNLVFATNNPNKAKEIQHLIGDMYTIKTLSEIGCDEDIVEDGRTLHENALLKSRFVSKKFLTDCFADDTGLLVEVLNGEPGVYSARYAGEQKNADDNMDLLLKNLSGISNRNASFITVISLIYNGQEYFFEGELKGKIATEKKGSNGFGYDPVFIPNGSNKTLAEFTLEEKNRISHRALAFNKLCDFLN